MIALRLLTALLLLNATVAMAATTPLYVGRFFGSFISITNTAFATTEQFGNGATASGSASTAVGNNATASATQATAIGRMSSASAANATALGENASSQGQNSTALGGETIAAASSSSAFGYNALANALSSTAVGATASVGVNGIGSVAIGVGATANQSGETIVGNGASSASPNATALGNAAVAVTGGTALGTAASAGFTNSTAVGINASTTRTNQVTLGDNSQTEVRIPGHETITGRQTNSAQTASAIVATDANKALTTAVIGAGLSFSGNTLSATGGSGGIYPTNQFLQIPAAALSIDNYADGLTLTPASVGTVTNYSPALLCADTVTNGFRFLWLPPTNWNAGQIKISIETVSISTNQGAQGQTNIVFQVKAAGFGTLDQVAPPTFAAVQWVTNSQDTNIFVKYKSVTLPITVGHANSTATNSVLIDVERIGSATGDLYTNLLGIAVTSIGIDYLVLPQNALPNSTP